MGFDFQPKCDGWEGHGWQVYTRKGPILNAEEIDSAQEKLGIPIPEMIFGKNEVGIQHKESGFKLWFNSLSALDLVDKTGEDGLIQVAHSQKWLKSRQKRGTMDRSASGDKVEGIIKPFDWTYSTNYRGECSQTLEDRSDSQDGQDQIPFERLKQPDPILFFDDVTLYEDELGDNGIVMLNVKVRVMAERLLILSRFFLRVDDVLFRVRDTRVYVEFENGRVIREYQQREEKSDVVKRRIPIGAKDSGPYLRDPNWVCQQLPVQKTVRDCITIP